MGWTAVYERWLMPERPGLRQFLLAVVAWLLPLISLRTSEGTDPRVLILSVAIGCGLGLAWSAASGWRWLQQAPASTLVVLLACFASAANLELMPRWDTLLRARRAMSAMDFYLQSRTSGTPSEPPSYATGEGRGICVVDEDGQGRMISIYTRDAIMRWSVRGFRPGCYVLVRADGSGAVLRDHRALEEAITAARAQR